MYWTLELASKLEDAPWPATKEELIDYAMRSGLSPKRRLLLQRRGILSPVNSYQFLITSHTN